MNTAIVNKLFPFHLTISRIGIITNHGISLPKLLNSKSIIGKELLKLFILNKPHCIKQVEKLLRYQDVVVSITTIDEGVKLTGQLIWCNQMKECTFYISPFLESLEILDKYDLSYDDFSIIDSSIDNISNVQSQKVMLKESQESERKLLEKNKELGKLKKQLEEREGVYNAFFQNTSIGMVINKPTGEVLQANNAFYNMIGYSKKVFEFNNMTIESITHPDDRIDNRNSIQKIFSGEVNNIVNQKRYISQSGKPFHTQTVATSIKDESTGQVTHLVELIEDLTERKNYENVILEKNKELMDTNKALDRFVYHVSHDLKSPVTALESMLNMLKRIISTHENPKTKQVIDNMDHSIRQFNRTIHDFLELTKVTKSKKQPTELLDLKKVLSTVLDSLKIQINESKCTLKIELKERYINFSLTSLKAILSNVIYNAIKYRSLDRELRISISTRKYKEHTLLSIKDTGIGIDLKKYRTKVFEMFGRIEGKVEGTGVGLYMVKSLLEESNGHIELESELGIGSTFKLYFAA